jgi:hypothetical protein
MSYLKSVGLSRTDIKDIARTFYLAHTKHCRETNCNSYSLYTCICTFFEEIKAKCFALAFDGRELYDFKGPSLKYSNKAEQVCESLINPPNGLTR